MKKAMKIFIYGYVSTFHNVLFLRAKIHYNNANEGDHMKRNIKDIHRIIIKVGSTSLCDTNGKINKEKILKIISQIATLKRQGYTVVLVSSGAIAAGMGKLGLESKPTTLPQKQALAAIGQAKLMEIYEEFFKIFDMKCSQILLNHDDFDDRKRLNNLNYTINALLDYDVVPIINENDALAVEEIKFGDNDTLASLLVPVIEAELLILVSDIDGLYTANPKIDKNATLINYVPKITKEVMRYAGDTSSNLGTGGMATKLKAARMVNDYGSHMCIVNGEKANSILNALKDEGTWFNGNGGKNLNAREHWLAYRSNAKGSIIVDEGCKKALVRKHVSLLPSGIIDVEGQFLSGQVVNIIDENKKTIGKGVVNYASDEIRLIKGFNTSEIENILHYKDYDEVIHANNMYITYEK